MPYTCCVIDCRSRGTMPERKFFRFPMLDYRSSNSLAKSQARQLAWTDALRRSDFFPARYKNARICDRHFISGKSANLYDITNPDWIPTKNLGYDQQTNAQFSEVEYNEADFLNNKEFKSEPVEMDWVDLPNSTVANMDVYAEEINKTSDSSTQTQLSCETRGTQTDVKCLGTCSAHVNSGIELQHKTKEIETQTWEVIRNIDCEAQT